MTALTSGKAPKKSKISNGVYWPYMVPGLIAFTLIVIVSFVWNIYLSFTKWNGLGFYPDWPVSGYYDILKAAVIDLVAGNTTPAEYREAIGSYYEENKP